MTNNVGTGPGSITNDGCAVDFYALLPSFGEPEIVHGAIPAGASILELGCGTGRILRPLSLLGHPVTGADDSADMLAHVADLPAVQSAIETLRLDRTFDVVLLASTMINSEPSQRRAFLATVRHHLAPAGVAVFQQNPPGWLERAVEVRDDPGGIRRTILAGDRDGSRISAKIQYEVGDRVWTHAWDSYEIGDEELAADLASADLAFGEWITDDHAWFTARPTPSI